MKTPPELTQSTDPAPPPPSRKGSGVRWPAGLAALLAGATVLNHLAAKRAERRRPPAGRFVEVDGTPVHYLERGAGPPVVMIHGNAVTSKDFVLSGMLQSLSGRHRVIAFDRPGFGYTPRPRGRPWTAKDQAKLLLGALAKLGVEQAVIVAHSWGTLVALQAALQQPGRIHGLVLISGYYWPTVRLDVPLLSPPAIPVLGDLLRFTVSPLLGRVMTPLAVKQAFAPAPVPDRFKAEFETAICLRPSQLRATAVDAAMIAADAARAARRYSEITCPVLLITGDGDRIVSFKHHSKRLAERLPQAEIEVIAGAGHMVHHTAPTAILAAMERFLQKSGPAIPAYAAEQQAITQPDPPV